MVVSLWVWCGAGRAIGRRIGCVGIGGRTGEWSTDSASAVARRGGSFGVAVVTAVKGGAAGGATGGRVARALPARGAAKGAGAVMTMPNPGGSGGDIAAGVVQRSTINNSAKCASSAVLSAAGRRHAARIAPAPLAGRSIKQGRGRDRLILWPTRS